VADGAVVANRDVVRLREHAAEGGAGGAIAARFAEAGLAPPADEQVRAALGLNPRVFRDAVAELKRAGRLRMLSGGLHFDVGALHALREKVVAYFRAHETLSPPEFKTLCDGLTRKHAIPLLEWLDAEGVTRRQGDGRVRGPRGR
jgi:selenocysteine-specific elongation factor